MSFLNKITASKTLNTKGIHTAYDKLLKEIRDLLDSVKDIKNATNDAVVERECLELYKSIKGSLLYLAEKDLDKYISYVDANLAKLTDALKRKKSKLSKFKDIGDVKAEELEQFITILNRKLTKPGVSMWKDGPYIMVGSGGDDQWPYVVKKIFSSLSTLYDNPQFVKIMDDEGFKLVKSDLSKNVSIVKK